MPSESEEVPGIAESWRIFTSHVRPRRLFREDDGVKGPLWFGSEPTSPVHIFANILRLFFAIALNPIYIFIIHPPKYSKSNLPRRLLWSIEEAKTPDAGLLESPSSLVQQGEGKHPQKGKYEVTNSKPRWLLKVEFHGTEIISQKQVRYERDRGKEEGSKPNNPPTGNFKSLQNDILQSGYTAISYAMCSAETLIPDSIYRLDSQPEIQTNGKRKYSLRDRQTIALALLDEYARARKTISGKQDGFEFIWLDEFCLSDEKLQDEQEIRRERETELGRLADIFRLAKRVVVFCHVEDCDHTGIDCPWGNRLFTMGEILNTPEVLQMTRTKESVDQKRLSSYIRIIPGPEFRSYMQAHATENEKWHLYNIMQHATNSGAVPWQAAIHSLIVEAIRRDDTDKFYDHRFIGRALNGLLPRRSQLKDLRGVDGWADLAWLLELNQGYYNAAMLAAVCKVAGDDVNEYRWWGKPILPKEGSERLEALVHAIPVTLRKTSDYCVHHDQTSEHAEAQPALSIIGPKFLTLSHWLQRDHTALYRRPEMRSLKRWAIGFYIVLNLGFFIVIASGHQAVGGLLVYAASLAFTILELLVGTMFIQEDEWVVIENRVAGDTDGAVYRWLKSQDPAFDNPANWGNRQMVPDWDPRDSPGQLSHLRAVTLINLRIGVLAGAVVTKRPNSMIALAVHGSGITCMLLNRNKKQTKATMAVKVGMANLPPFVLAQAEESGTIYICSHSEEEKKKRTRKPWAYLSLSTRPPSPVPSLNAGVETESIALKKFRNYPDSK